MRIKSNIISIGSFWVVTTSLIAPFAQAGSADPMAGWKSARSSFKSRTLRLDIVGDSTSELCGQGTGPTNCSNLWVNVVRSAGQSTWGNAGYGYAPIGNNAAVGDSGSVAPYVTVRGTGYEWVDSSTAVGPIQENNAKSDFSSLLHLPSANTATSYISLSGISGDTTAVFGAVGPSYTDCTVAIGSVFVGSMLTQKSTTVEGAISLEKHASGTYEVYLNGSAGNCAVTGVGGYSSTAGGFIINDFAHGYAGTEAFAADPSRQLYMARVAPSTPDAVIIALGINNLNNATPISLATYTAHIKTLGEYYKSINPNVSVILMNENATSSVSNDLGLTAAGVQSALKTLAAENGWAFLDETTVLGTLANEQAKGYIRSDNTHLSDSGSPLIGKYVWSFLNQ